MTNAHGGIKKLKVAKRGDPMTIPEKIKQEILWYLDNYWSVVATIGNARGEVLYKGTMKDLDIPFAPSGLSDVVSSKAIRLTQLDLDEMADWIRVVNDAYHYYRGHDVNKAKLIWLTYLESNPRRKSKIEIMGDLFVEKNAYYNWLDEICGVIALKAAGKRLIKI